MKPPLRLCRYRNYLTSWELKNRHKCCSLSLRQRRVEIPGDSPSLLLAFFLIGQLLCIRRSPHTYLHRSSGTRGLFKVTYTGSIYWSRRRENKGQARQRYFNCGVKTVTLQRRAEDRTAEGKMLWCTLSFLHASPLCFYLPPCRTASWMIWYLVKVPSLHYTGVAFLQESLRSALKVNTAGLCGSRSVLVPLRHQTVKLLLGRSIGPESKLPSKFSTAVKFHVPPTAHATVVSQSICA